MESSQLLKGKEVLLLEDDLLLGKRIESILPFHCLSPIERTS
jgi:hypothetical protein